MGGGLSTSDSYPKALDDIVAPIHTDPARSCKEPHTIPRKTFDFFLSATLFRSYVADHPIVPQSCVTLRRSLFRSSIEMDCKKRRVRAIPSDGVACKKASALFANTGSREPRSLVGFGVKPHRAHREDKRKEQKGNVKMGENWEKKGMGRGKWVTAGHPHTHTKCPYRCYLPVLAGFGISYCVGPGCHKGDDRLRRRRDSNPRYLVRVHTISNRAPSATRSPLQKRAIRGCTL